MAFNGPPTTQEQPDNGESPIVGQAFDMPQTPTSRQRPFSPQEEAVAKKLLTINTKRYEQVTPLHGLRSTLGALDYNQPIFARFWIPAMEQDPHLIYGFRMLTGPVLTKAKFKINSDMPEVAEFVDRMIKRFWLTGVHYSLTSLRYGFCGCETIYKYNRKTKYIEFDKLKYLHPNDVTPVLVDGLLKGMKVKRVKERDGTDKEQYLGLPKMLWSVHERSYDRWWGRSRYTGAFIPWYEYWQPKGFRNIRHLGMYKYSFRGPNIGYPEGSQQDPVTGEQVPNVLRAEEMADRAEAGATLIYPTVNQEYGGWEVGEPTVMNIPDALLQYGNDLKHEKWEGIGVPPEIAESDEGGGGSFSGRRVPQQAFFSNEQEIANEQVFDFDEQNLRYIVALNFGPDADYEIEPVPIIVTLQQEEMAQVTGHMPGDPNDTSGIYGDAGLADGEEGVDDGGEEEGGLSALSNGRIEDRKSNPFNKAEKAAADKGKKKPKSKK